MNVAKVPAVNVDVPSSPFIHALSQYKSNSVVIVGGEASLSTTGGFYRQASSISKHRTHGSFGRSLTGHKKTGSCSKKGRITMRAPIIEYWSEMMMRERS